MNLLLRSAIMSSVSELNGSRGARRALWVVATATLLALMNYNATFSTLTPLSADLHVSPAAQTWLLTALSLGLTIALPATGRLADGWGRARVLAGALALLALSCVAAAMAGTAWGFSTARLVQGIATAAVLTAGLGLLSESAPTPSARARASGTWSAMLALGVAVGPLASALLAQLDWRLWYLLAALVASSCAAALRPLRRSGRGRLVSFDVLGTVTFASGAALVLTALTLVRQDWADPRVPVCAALAAALLTAFVIIERRAPAPLLDLQVLRGGDVRAFVIGSAAIGLAVLGFMSCLPTLLEHVNGASAVGASTAVAIWSGSQFLTSLHVRRLPWPPRRLLSTGLVLAAAGTAALVGLPTYPWLAFALVVAGLGGGMANVGVARLSVESVPAQHAAMGSATANTARYAGASIGVAAVVLLVGLPSAARTGATLAAVCCAGLAALAAVVLARVTPSSDAPSSTAPRL